MTTYPLRFTHNQIGTMVEYFKDGDWRGIQLIKPSQYNNCPHETVVSEWINQATQKGAPVTKTPTGYTLTVPDSMTVKESSL